jgi:hypothetical protein
MKTPPHPRLSSTIENFQSPRPKTRYNSLLVLKNIIYGPNVALQRFRVCSHDEPLHRLNLNVNLYFQIPLL